MALAVHSNGDIYAGTENNGLLRSTDNGQTWVQTNLRSKHITALAVDANNTLFAGTWNGVFRSVDNGDHKIIA